MYAYIARQPIFNANKEIRSYELFYRDGRNGNVSNIQDGDAATRNVLSDAISLFGLSKLTNGLPAYIHFTRNLILNDFVLLTDPQEVVVEVMADISNDDVVIKKLEELRDNGFTLVLSGYDGSVRFNPILPLVNIVKVDFRRFTRDQLRRMSKKLKRIPVTMLAEKVETQGDFDTAKSMDFLLFQGYYFEKPRLLNKRIPTLTDSPYGRLLNALLQENVDFDGCAKLILDNANMTYLLLQKTGFPYRNDGKLENDIRRALIQMGSEELRRYALLMLARENNMAESEEPIHRAYLRGLFMERLMERVGDTVDSGQGFLLGMFSLMENILGTKIEDILDGVQLSQQIKDVLSGQGGNEYETFLHYVMIYEMENPKLLLPKLPKPIGDQEIGALYMQCMVDTDLMINSLGG